LTQKGHSPGDNDEINSSGYQITDLNAFLDVETIKKGMTSNVEMPMVVDFKELVYEMVKYSNMDVVINTGSYLVLFCLAVVLFSGFT